MRVYGVDMFGHLCLAVNWYGMNTRTLTMTGTDLQIH